MQGSETLEREAELDGLAAALDDAAGGAGRLLVLEGPPGIGKTRLVEDVRALAKARKFGRLAAAADELERSLPWGIVRQLVERSVLRYSGDTRAAILGGPAGRALEALDRVEDSDGSETAIGRALHSLWWVAADLSAERPLLITIDDAQWADVPSLRFVAYLARRLQDLPIALIVATRPPDATGGPLADIAAGRTGRRILPAPLSRDGVAALAAGRGDEVAAEVAIALHEAAGGNPFLTGQLLDELERQDAALSEPRTARAVRDVGPRTISRALLGRLSPDALALASAAAVLGMRSSPGATVSLAELDGDRATAASDELRRAHVLAADRRELSFVHSVIREAVLAELPATERARLHSIAARSLEDAGAPVERVALHLAAAPTATLPGAAHVLRAAAKTSLADGDAGAAATYLERAVSHEPADTRLTADLGLALLRAGSHAPARERLRAALRETPEARERAALIAAIASATLSLDGPDAAARELRAEIDRLGEDGDRDALLLLDARLAVITSYRSGEDERWGERLRRFADLPGDTAEERAVLASVVRLAFAEAQPAERVLEVAARALHGGELLTGSDEDVLAWGSALHAVILADGIELARRELELARTTLLPNGSPLDFAFVSVVEMVLWWRIGDLVRCDAACAAIRETLALTDPGPFTDGLRALAARFGALCAIERGDLADAAERIDELGRRPDFSQATVPAHRVLHARAALALASGDFALARREAETLGSCERAAGIDNPAVPWRAVAALALYRLDAADEARALAAEQLALARGWGAASDIGAALRVAARVGPAEERVALLSEAVEVLTDAPWRLGLAGAWCDLGEVIGVAGRRSEAREPLHSALELAAACGAVALRDRARDALARLGDRPRELMFSGAEDLTASERRVAEMAAAGRSNREIAQELFITPKTVENHLGRVYLKLGVKGRRELSGALSGGPGP